MTTVTFTGVKLNKNAMAGFLQSKDIVEKFSSNWIPAYQRGRVLDTNKISALKTIYKEKKEIDGVKVAFYGTVVITGKNTYELSGRFNVIDGQQRLFALKESGVLDMNIPVELYLECDEQKEINLFRQYNKAGTSLTMGDLAKSCNGSFGNLIKQTLKNSNLPIKVFVNSNPKGINLSTYCRLIYSAYLRAKNDSGTGIQRLGTKSMVRFLEKTIDQSDVRDVNRFVTSVMADYVERFGEYDKSVLPYRRSFFSAWFYLMVNNFYKPGGHLVFGDNSTKINMLAVAALKNAKVKEYAVHSSDETVQNIYNVFVDYVNAKKKSEKNALMYIRAKKTPAFAEAVAE